MDQSLNLADTLELLLAIRDSQMGLIQWWASITLVLMAVAYFGRKHMNQPMALVLLLIYVSFSYAMVHMAFQLGAQQSQMARYLSSISIQDDWTYSVTNTIARLQLPLSFFVALVVMIAGAFLACVGSLLMCMYRRNSQNETRRRPILSTRKVNGAMIFKSGANAL